MQTQSTHTKPNCCSESPSPLVTAVQGRRLELFICHFKLLMYHVFVSRGCETYTFLEPCSYDSWFSRVSRLFLPSRVHESTIQVSRSLLWESYPLWGHEQKVACTGTLDHCILRFKLCSLTHAKAANPTNENPKPLTAVSDCLEMPKSCCLTTTRPKSQLASVC